MAHTLLGFTADEWKTVMQGFGSLATAVIGAAGLAYARLAMKRASGAKAAAEDAVEAGGRAETAVTGGTSDLTAEVAELRALVSKRLPAAVPPRTAIGASIDRAAAMVSGRAEHRQPPDEPPAAPVTPQEEATAGAGQGAVAEASQAAAEAPAPLDTQAVWTVLGQRR
jgi:hypothetical protein